MFDITETELRFKNRVVARLAPLPLSVLRDFEETIADYTTADDFEEEHAAALKAEYDQGFESGQEEARNDLENALADAKAKIEADGFNQGHAQGIRDSGFASDAARVEVLLLALQEMHNTLQPLWLGFEEAGKFKRRPAKIGEAKRIAQSACAAAHRAINAYRQE